MDVRRLWVAALVGAWPSSAVAAPAVVYIPSGEETLVPVATCPVPQAGQPNSALNCSAVPEETAIGAYPGDFDALVAGIEDALAPYDVYVTTERPPDYLPFTMLLVPGTDEPESSSFTCTSAPVYCSAIKRNGIGIAWGNTENCVDADPLHAALYAFGRLSGLEGSDDPADPMGYPPDYTMPATDYQDACSNLVQQIGFNDQDMQIALPLECTSFDHVECPVEDQQNGHADLLEAYGARTVDEDPPMLSNLTPVEGAVVLDLHLDVDIADADPFVGGRWTVSSPALEGAVPGGVFRICTNDACEADLGNDPLKATDSDWAVELVGLPFGDYEITFEASDFHGNETVFSYMVVVGEGGGGSTGDDVGSSDEGPLDTGGEGEGEAEGSLDDTAGDTTTGPSTPATTGPFEPPDGDTDADPTTGLIGNPLACDCRSGGRPWDGAWLIGLVLLLRRRRRVGRTTATSSGQSSARRPSRAWLPLRRPERAARGDTRRRGPPCRLSSSGHRTSRA